MTRISFKTAFKAAFLGAIAAGALLGVLTTRAHAASSTAQTFVVLAGVQGPGNMDVLQFAPQSLKIHRGDTVTWAINGFHDVRFDSKPVDLVVQSNANGKTVPAFNPAMALPTIKSGASYTGGVVGSGLPSPDAPPVFSLVMDLAPGTYSYVCDVHPGMVGTITVVADDQAIPSPSEDTLQAMSEMGSSIGNANNALAKLEEAKPSTTTGKAAVTAGSGDTGRVTINQYFPFVTTIKAGQSLTWTVPATSPEPHTVSWPAVLNQEVAPIPVAGKPPILAFGKTLAPLTQSGATVKPGDSFSSGLLAPGQSFTLTFAQPGVYPYTCNIHPGMNGVVIVQ